MIYPSLIIMLFISIKNNSHCSLILFIKRNNGNTVCPSNRNNSFQGSFAAQNEKVVKFCEFPTLEVDAQIISTSFDENNGCFKIFQYAKV